MARGIELQYWMRYPKVKELVKGTLPAYRRKKVIIVPCTNITLQQLSWDGGSRNEYFFCGITGGVFRCWGEYGEGKNVTVPQGRAIIQTGTFMGREPICRIYINPDDVKFLLPDYKPQAA